ncbi:transposase [Candidatus Berkelbacteria bacterium]|nr:transposase [Candidatus Berkelbacteria bacterium]
MKEQFDQLVSVICFELMPNHWHFLLRQEKDHGISQMVSQISNSYTKHFNTKYERVGPLFQGPFKAVLIESEEQLLHVSRYIHLNALVGLVVPNFETLVKYPWSSLSDYLKGESDWLDMALVMAHFKSSSDYLGFLKDQVDFAKQLKRIKHLAIDLD